MPLPLIPVAIALVVTSLAGAGAGAKGVADMAESKKIADKAKQRLAEAHQEYQNDESRTARRLTQYGRIQLTIQTTTLARWVTWLEANERKVRRLEHAVVDGVDVVVPDLPELRLVVVEASSLLSGGAAAAVSAVVAQQAALAGVRSLAAAGTGAAISGLSGAAAESATLAWLGGGALATGGGGVAAGGLVLTGVAVAPAMLLGGITLAVQGDKARTQAEQYKSQVLVAIAEMETQQDLFTQLRRRVGELESVLKELNEQAVRSIGNLERLDFDPENLQHVELFQETALLMRAVGNVLDATILDADGKLSDQSAIFTERSAA